ncbi:MAG: YggS family pyridoxal phosphate-dependent enzyme [Gemmatimonadota bacterium]|nr:YggS family pyridoxal phosphate-dependent enzyme [Gemmatimonadota bacterium]
MTSEGIETRLARVRERMAAAAERAGRRPEDIDILPVTKGHPARAIEAVRALGLERIGENRVGEAEGKRAELGETPGLAWHMVGRLQRNKARRAVRIFDAIESVGRLKLAETLSRIVEDEGRSRVEILVQVNASGEEAKGGLAPAETVDTVAEICALPGLAVAGLMTMAPYGADEATLREVFGRTRELGARCEADIPAFEGRVLSMGMSDDFEVAIEEGSTRVRLGTVLVGER